MQDLTEKDEIDLDLISCISITESEASIAPFDDDHYYPEKYNPTSRWRGSNMTSGHTFGFGFPKSDKTQREHSDSKGSDIEALQRALQQDKMVRERNQFAKEISTLKSTISTLKSTISSLQSGLQSALKDKEKENQRSTTLLVLYRKMEKASKDTLGLSSSLCKELTEVKQKNKSIQNENKELQNAVQNTKRQLSQMNQYKVENAILNTNLYTRNVQIEELVTKNTQLKKIICLKYALKIEKKEVDCF